MYHILYKYLIFLAGDDDHILPLCLETVTEGNSVLIFCPTKNWCESLAVNIAREFHRLKRTPQPKTPGMYTYIGLP